MNEDWKESESYIKPINDMNNAYNRRFHISLYPTTTANHYNKPYIIISAFI